MPKFNNIIFIMPAVSAGPYSLVLKHSVLADGGWIDDLACMGHDLAWDTGPGTPTRDRAIVQVADSIDRSSTRRVACARRRRASTSNSSTSSAVASTCILVLLLGGRQGSYFTAPWWTLRAPSHVTVRGPVRFIHA